MGGETLNSYILIIGSLGMGVLTLGVILFIVLYQRKLIRKENAYRNIERLLQDQELKSAYYLIEGQEQERKRIASDIHDNVGNLLATLKIYSDLVLQKEQDAEQRRLNEKVNTITELVTKEIRKISHSLDSGIVQSFGLRAAIDHLAEAVQQSGTLEFKLHYAVSPVLSGDVSLHLYRIVQELVTNTLKHAHASRIRVELTEGGDEVKMIYEDNGSGFDPALVSTGIGLQNIRNRVHQLQGELNIQSTPQGSTFIIELPLIK